MKTMNKLLPIFKHGLKRPLSATNSWALPNAVAHNSWDARHEGQRRSLATNRRKQRMKAKSKAKGKGNQQQKRKGKHQNNNLLERSVIRPPKNYLKKLPKASQVVSIPPALLVPTASPYVYISQTALASDEEDEEPIDPSKLFSEVAYNEEGILTLPPLFAKGDFHYFSPKKDLDYNFPMDGQPEIAFLGRSNVGKSSLINAIMRKNLCMTSRTPGRTQLPYYYGMIPKQWMAEHHRHQHQQQTRDNKQERTDPKLAQGFIVDLPGYGYGRAPTNITENWQQDTQDLLLHRRHEAGVLERLYLLMDARREGPNEHDRIVMRWLEDAEIPYSIVLTKADRVSVPQVVKQVNEFCLRYASQQHHHTVVAQSPVVHVTSSAQGWGVHELMVSIEAEFCADEEDEYDYEEEDTLE